MDRNNITDVWRLCCRINENIGLYLRALVDFTASAMSLIDR